MRQDFDGIFKFLLGTASKINEHIVQKVSHEFGTGAIIYKSVVKDVYCMY